MAKTTFDIPQRYDPKQAQDGVWFEVRDEYEQLWGTFKLAYLDLTDPAWKKEREKLKARYAKDFRLKKKDEDFLLLEAFLQFSLLDWKDVKANGKEVSYTEARAREFFGTDEIYNFAFPTLAMYALDVRNYNDKAIEQGVETVEDKDEELGN
ncbi:hypothetical protein PF049_00200 [Erythrobacteraceae bacterium WH01K]|nr:hypothetical protein PF049_00200 [Erythrobacteraceae bacterium WH01K]